MTFTQFISFTAVARNRSITKAAQELHVSQPSVSKHLKNLEESYKVKLFERDGGVLELTEQGRILLRRATAVLSHLEKLDKELKPTSNPASSQPLKVAGSYAASALLLPSVLAKFGKRHPGTRIILRTGSTNGVKQMLLKSEVELALLNEDPGNPNLFAEFFRDEKLVIFVTPNHRLAKKQVLTLRDLNESPLVVTGGRGRLSTIEKILNRHTHQGLKPTVSIRCSTPEAVKEIVKKGPGVGILFKDTLALEIRRKAFKLLTVPGLNLVGQSYIIYYKDRPLSPAAQEFLCLVRERKTT